MLNTVKLNFIVKLECDSQNNLTTKTSIELTLKTEHVTFDALARYISAKLLHVHMYQHMAFQIRRCPEMLWAFTTSVRLQNFMFK